MNQLTDVVKNLIIINVLVFFGLSFLPQGMLPDFRLFSPESQFFRPYQLITHMFMHANIAHLFFNMFGLYIFGPMVEHYIGSKKFFLLYISAGVIALLFHLGISYIEISDLTGYARAYKVNTPMLGASGAVYGIMAGFATLFPNLRLQLLFPPIPIRAKYMALAYVGLDLYQGLASSNTGVAHFAHIGGAVLGFLLIRYWRKTGFK